MTSPTPAPVAPYVHREVPLDFAGQRLAFATALELFSSHQVDTGSRMLLRTIELFLVGRDQSTPPAHVLDLGCGYGAIGVALATLPAVSSAHLVDRDVLALDLAHDNAHRNGVAGRVTVGASLGFDGVEDDRFDLVVSNIPGKAGDAVIRSLLLGALGVLRPDGRAAVVVIEPIRELVASTLARPEIEVTLRRDTADYSVFHYRPAPDASFPPPGDQFADGVYDHGTFTFPDALEERVTIATVQGLPNYDRFDVTEHALTRRLPRLPRGGRVLVANVGQGAFPAYILRSHPEARFLLVDRDLLALRTARRALLALGCAEDAVETRHVGAWSAEASLPATADLVTGVLHEDGSPAAVAAEYLGLMGAIAPGGRAVIAGTSTAITRLLAIALPPGLKASRTKHRGTSFLELAREALR
ncbi:MAG: methyltransferase, partial [Chloroflexi bacterium]|nr:methyltransferase [Chloroflexota bacterium]